MHRALVFTPHPRFFVHSSCLPCRFVLTLCICICPKNDSILPLDVALLYISMGTYGDVVHIWECDSERCIISELSNRF
jgi:hypothetical protein